MLINTLKSRVYRLVTAKFGFSSSKPTKSTIPDKLALKSHKDREKDRSKGVEYSYFYLNFTFLRVSIVKQYKLKASIGFTRALHNMLSRALGFTLSAKKH